MTENNGPPAVEVAGFLRSGLGLGEAARLYVEALRAAGVPVHTTTVDLNMPRHKTAQEKTVEFEDVEHAGARPISLICVNAPELGQFRAQVGDAFFDRPRNVGSWAWEVDKVPSEWLPMFGVFDEIWVYSRYVADNLTASAAPARVVRVPLPIVEPAVEGPPPDLGIPDKFTFLFMFDFFSTLKRKNPLGLIGAFKRAFSPGEGPQLLLKSFNGDYKPDRLAEVQRAAADHPDIHVVDRYVTGSEKDALVAACDCYVSLHRAEGFGLTLGEAMVLGKPVIATNFSGNTDFMTPRNSYLVNWSLTRVGEGGDNYPADGHWAQPDLDHAAALMREVWENSDAARERGAKAREEVLRDWSLEAIGEIARARLEAIAPRSSSHSQRRRALPRIPGAVEGAESKLAYDPDDDDAGGGLRRAARRLSMQAIRPYTYHQDELNALLVRGLRETSDRLDRLAVDVHEGLADLREVLHATRARPGAAHPAITNESEKGESVLAFDRETEGPELSDIRFEDVFRGSEDLIRERQAGYVRMLGEPEWVLDLGSGRGEFLDLLSERGIRARGVELDEDLVERSRSRGHDAVVADVVEYLDGLESRSVPAIFSAQVIEHLPLPQLKRFLELSADRLAPGGVAIFETVNPHCASALKAFWTDPTHQHPLFPEVVLALARFAGFDSGYVHFPDGSGQFDNDIYACPDYAVVLRRRP
jgi:glycosyltransferase involved in cell wall biosynthesis/SAM-dependent methyltransferase